MRLSPSRRAGFSLIELMVVVIIVGLIGSMSAMNFKASQENAANAQMESNVRTVAMALERYADDHGGSYPATLLDAGFTPSYLPGKKLPSTPWNHERQAVQIDLTASATAPSDSYWASLKKASRNHTVPIGDPTIPTRHDPPTQKTDVGAIAYSNISGIYYLVGTGIYAGHLMATAPATNNAVGTGAAPN